MPTTTQFVVSGQSKPGVLAEVAAVLGAAGVNIKAFSAPEVTGPGKLRLIVADVDAARIALRKSKIKFREETALILSLENKPGALKQVADSLTRARINVKCGYCTPSREGKRAIVVLTVSNTTKALGVYAPNHSTSFSSPHHGGEEDRQQSSSSSPSSFSHRMV